MCKYLRLIFLMGYLSAEISLEKKNSISHRYRSLKKLEKKISKLNLNEWTLERI